MNSIFSYEKGNSFIHKAPPLLKLLVVLSYSVFIFQQSYLCCLIALPVLFFIALVSSIKLTSVFKDLKPILYYCFFVFVVKIVGAYISTNDVVTTLLEVLTLVLRLLNAMIITSIFFRSTSSLSISLAFEKLHLGSLSIAFSLLFTMIPMVFRLWNQLNLSWKSRGGRGGINCIKTLFPVFLIQAVRKADTMRLALENRGIN